MKQILPDVWETKTESPFPGLTTHAYLMVREQGNVLFYNTGNREEIDAFSELGGVAWQFLSHEDELGDTLGLIGERYGAKLGGHVNEREAFARYRAPDILFSRRERLLDGIEVIPTPGHSPGSSCFFVHSPHGQTYLFTGDTLFRSKDGSWVAGFISGHTTAGQGRQMAESLELLRALAPNVVIGSAFSGTSGYQVMAPEEWPGHLDRALEGLHRQIDRAAD